MIKPRPPHQAADKFLRLAKLAVTLGMEFEDAAIGVEHELIESIGPALPRLSSALQTLSQDMRRQAMTPPPEPPPAPKPTPILDYLEAKEQAPTPAEAVPEVPKLRPFVVVVDVEPPVPVAQLALSGDGPNPEEEEGLRDLLGGYRSTCRLIEVAEADQSLRHTPWITSLEPQEVIAKIQHALAISPKPRPFAAFVGRNPVFYVEAASIEAAGDAINAAMPEHSITRVQAVEPEWAAARKLPDLAEWAKANPTSAPDPKVPAEEPPTKVPPTVPAFPTESPRDPLVMLSVEELGLKASMLAKVQQCGIVFAAQLWDDIDENDAFSAEDENYVRDKLQAWELARRKRIIDDGSWLDEELTYAAFRMGDAPEFWAKMRERGATDSELRDAINKRFFAMGGVDCRHRAGYRFYSGPAPAFYMTGDKPKRDAEPALEGKHLVDAVRRLLAIPTREEPAKAPAKRKAVKA